MSTIAIALLCGVEFTVGAILTLALWGWMNTPKDTPSKEYLELQKRVVQQQDQIIAQRHEQLELLKEIRNALQGGAK